MIEPSCEGVDFLDASRRYRAEIYRDGNDADWKTNPYSIAIDTRDVRSGSQCSTVGRVIDDCFANSAAAI